METSSSFINELTTNCVDGLSVVHYMNEMVRNCITLFVSTDTICGTDNIEKGILPPATSRTSNLYICGIITFFMRYIVAEVSILVFVKFSSS